MFVLHVFFRYDKRLYFRCLIGRRSVGGKLIRISRLVEFHRHSQSFFNNHHFSYSDYTIFGCKVYICQVRGALSLAHEWMIYSFISGGNMINGFSCFPIKWDFPVYSADVTWIKLKAELQDFSIDSPFPSRILMNQWVGRAQKHLAKITHHNIFPTISINSKINNKIP